MYIPFENDPLSHTRQCDIVNDYLDYVPGIGSEWALSTTVPLVKKFLSGLYLKLLDLHIVGCTRAPKFYHMG